MTHPIAGTGAACFQLPAPVIDARTTLPLDGVAWRILNFLLWEAHRKERWPRNDGMPADTRVRYPAAAILKGAGLERGRDLRPLRRALGRLSATWFVRDQNGKEVGFPIILDPVALPGGWIELTIPEGLMGAHWRPLQQYALVNILQMRDLKKPLDFALYGRACLVARQHMPVFGLTLDQMADAAGLPAGMDWAALRRPFLGACRRVAVRTGATFRIQAWCSGQCAGIDTVRVQVLAGSGRRWRPFPIEHRASFYEVDDDGARAMEQISAGFMEIFAKTG